MRKQGLFHGVSGLILAIFLFTGCRSTYYSAMEKFGVHKRDLLKRNVVAARDDQKEASEQFKDALTRLRELYNFQGGNLGKTYDALTTEFERASEKAADVRERIREVEQVAEDLFREWEREIGDISSASLKSKSREQLRLTRQRYEDLHSALVRAEKSMEPVLGQFRDHVLYLKHNLNAQAIAALKGEATSVQMEITQLINEMNAAIAKSDEFIKTLP